jgi:hypothetical protein
MSSTTAGREAMSSMALRTLTPTAVSVSASSITTSGRDVQRRFLAARNVVADPTTRMPSSFERYARSDSHNTG